MPEPRSPKPYRVYRGGRASAHDPEAARFDFSRRPHDGGDARRTPPGLSKPEMSRYRGSALPGRPVARPGSGGAAARPAAGGRRFHLGRRRGILLAIGAVVLLTVGWLYLGYRSFSNEIAHANARLDKRTRRALAPAGNILTSPQVTIVLGTDNRSGSDAGARSDSILLLRTDPGNHRFSLLSIPRDLRVPIPGHGEDKINSAFAYGGPPLAIRTIDALTGLRINHVVLVDFTGFRDLVDALGGVTVHNPTPIVSSQPFDGIIWHFSKGNIHLDGRKALAYSRIRHTTNPADSDITRTERQQRVLQALAHQLVSPSSLLHLPSIGSALARPLTTDLSAPEFLGLGWIKFRAGKTLQCHFGGTPEVIGGADVLVGSEQNRQVMNMFLGRSAPQPPPKGELFGAGCTGG